MGPPYSEISSKRPWSATYPGGKVQMETICVNLLLYFRRINNTNINNISNGFTNGLAFHRLYPLTYDYGESSYY